MECWTDLNDDRFIRQVDEQSKEADVESCDDLRQFVGAVELEDRVPVEQGEDVAEEFEATLRIVDHLQNE